MSHKHEWILQRSYDSWHKPKRTPQPSFTFRSSGLFGGAYVSYQSILEDVVEIIRSGDEPHIKYETWICNCGKEKTNHHDSKSLNEFLNSLTHQEEGK